MLLVVVRRFDPHLATTTLPEDEPESADPDPAPPEDEPDAAEPVDASDAPAPDEIVVAIAAATGGRPHHRIGDRYQDMKEMGVDHKGGKL